VISSGRRRFASSCIGFAAISPAGAQINTKISLTTHRTGRAGAQGERAEGGNSSALLLEGPSSQTRLLLLEHRHRCCSLLLLGSVCLPLVAEGVRRLPSFCLSLLVSTGESWFWGTTRSCFLMCARALRVCFFGVVYASVVFFFE
jgi:hypothetical protein